MAASARDTPASSAGGMGSPGSPFEAALEGTLALTPRLHTLPHAPRAAGAAAAAGQLPLEASREQDAATLVWQEVEELACQLVGPDQASTQYMDLICCFYPLLLLPPP